MEQERENILEETVIEIEETASEPKHPMKWFKFIIYVQLFLNMVLFGIDGILCITGAQYGESAELVYAHYGNALRAFDILTGVLNLGLAAFAFYARMRLAKFKKNGPKCYLIFWGTQAVFGMLYSFCVALISGQDTITMLSSIIGTICGTIMALGLNYNYFEKRKALFIN